MSTPRQMPLSGGSPVVVSSSPPLESAGVSVVVPVSGSVPPVVPGGGVTAVLPDS